MSDLQPPTSADDPAAKHSRLIWLLEWLVIIGALVTIPLLIIDQTFSTGFWHHVARYGDWAVWIVFLLDLVVMLALVKDRRAFLRSHPLDLIVVVVTPPFLPVGFQWVRVLRVLRVVRLLRLPRLLKRKLSLETVEYAGLIVLIIFLGGAAAFSAAERVSYGDAMYWAVGTMTTVGTSVKVTTALAKVVACVLMAVGAAFFALITAALAQRFLAAEAEELEQSAAELEGSASELEASAANVDVATQSVVEDDAEILAQVRALSAQISALEASLSRRAAT